MATCAQEPHPRPAPIVQRPRTLAFHASNTGSNPVGGASCGISAFPAVRPKALMATVEESIGDGQPGSTRGVGHGCERRDRYADPKILR